MGGSVSRAELIDIVNTAMSLATDPGKKPAARAAALDKLEALCHDGGVTGASQSVLSEAQHISEMLALFGSRQEEVALAAFRLCCAVTSTVTAAVKVSVGKRLTEDLLELLHQHRSMTPRRLLVVVQLLSNLVTEDIVRGEVERAAKKGTGGVPEFMTLLNNADPRIQLASLKALTALSVRPGTRQLIMEGGILTIVGLCFVGTMYGDIQLTALHLLANLSKDPEVLAIVGPQGVMYRLTQVINGVTQPEVPKAIAYIFCNFSVYTDLTHVEARKTMTMLFSLLFSPSIDDVVQGLWAVANYLKDPSMRREFIESDGLKLLFSVLRYADKDPPVWYEIARAITMIASGGNAGSATLLDNEVFEEDATPATGTTEEKEFLVREGSLEAIVTICQWCSSEVGVTEPNDDPDAEDCAQTDQLYNMDGEEVNQSARYICMTVCAKALCHLTTFGYVCQLLCDVGGSRFVAQLLRADYNTEGQQYASAVVANLAKHREPCHTIVMEDAVVGPLVDLLKYSTHSYIHAEVAAALANIANMGGPYLRLITESGAPIALINILKKDTCSTTTAVHSTRALAQCETNEVKFDIIAAGGVPLLIKFSTHESRALKKACAAALRMLSELLDDSHQLIMAKDGVFIALAALLLEEDTFVVKEAARAITLLTSRIESNKLAFLEQDGLRVVVKHLCTSDDDLLIQILSIIGNLGSLAATTQLIPAGDAVLRQLCFILQMDRFALTLQAMRCLVFLTKHAEDATPVLGILSPMTLIEMALSPNATLQRHAIHLMCNLARDLDNCKILHEAGFVRTLEMLFSSENFDVILLSVQCMGRMMAANTAEYLQKGSMIALLIEVARKSLAMHAETDASHVSTFAQGRNLSMLEHVVTALRVFCNTEEGARHLVDRHQCISLLLEALVSNGIDARKEAACCLCEIAEYPELCDQIIEEGGVPQIITTLKQSATMIEDMERELSESSAKLDSDTQLKERQQRQVGASHGAVKDVGLPYEAREALMNSMDGQILMRSQNASLQKSCLKVLYHVADDYENQKTLIDAYHWKTFLTPLRVPDIDCQAAAAKACFRLLQCGVQLPVFIELRGVSYLLRALEFDDDEVKHQAALGLGVVSSTDPVAFRSAIIDAGGVGSIMALARSSQIKIRTPAFEAIARLCANKELGEEFVSKNVLSSIQLASTGRARFHVSSYATLVRVVGLLGENERIRWKVLEKGGATLLFRSLMHFDQSVATLASSILVKIVSPEADVRECLTRCKMASAIVESIQLCPFPEAVYDMLQVFSYMCERDAFRDRIGTPALVDALLSLTDDKNRGDEFKRRADANRARRAAAAEECQRKQSLDASVSMLAGGADDGGVVGRAKGLGDTLSAQALDCLRCLLRGETLLGYATGSQAVLEGLVQSFGETSSPERICNATKVIAGVLEVPACHAGFLAAGGLHKLSVVAKVDHSEAKLNVAACFEMLCRDPADVSIFSNARVCRGLRALLPCNVRDVQIAVSTAVERIAALGELSLARYSIMPDILAYVETEYEQLQMKALSIVTLFAPMYREWLNTGTPTETADARGQLTPAVAKIMGVYRRSLHRSAIAGMSLHAWNAVLGTDPTAMCLLVDPAMVLDLKRAVLQQPRDIQDPPKLSPGKCLIDVAGFVKNGARFPLPLDFRDTKLHAARALALMSTCHGDGKASCLVNVLKALTIEDMIKTAYAETLAGTGDAFVALLLRMAANCVARGTQMLQLADDRTGLLKLVFALTSHPNPHVVSPAVAILSKASELPAGHSRMLAVCGIDAVARLALDMVAAMNSVATLHGKKQLDSGPTLPLVRIVNELARLMANLADGGSAGLRSLKEGSEAVRQLQATLPRHVCLDVKVHVGAALALLDEGPETLSNISATFSQLVAAARDRVDNDRVHKGVLGLCSLARTAGNHEELVQSGGLSALCGALRNPTPAVFRTATWGLVHIALGGVRDGYDVEADRANKQARSKLSEARLVAAAKTCGDIVAEGVAPAVARCMNGKRDDLHVSCKLVSVLLRHPVSLPHILQCQTGKLAAQHSHDSF